jgi:hypothetical protein
MTAERLAESSAFPPHKRKTPPAEPAAPRNRNQRPDSEALYDLDVDCLGALAHLIGFNLEADLLAISKVADAGGLQRADVNEDVLASTFGGDEAEAFGRIEKLYGASLAHWDILFPVS